MRFLFAILILFSEHLLASDPPATFTYQGKAYRSDGVTPVDGSSVLFKIQIYSPDGSCLLFQETHLRDMSTSGGLFSLTIGEGTNANVSSLSLIQAFDNTMAKSGASACAYTPVSGDTRRLRFSWNDGVEVVNLSSDQITTSVPYSWTAQNLEGIRKNQLIQVSSQTTQSKVDTVFSGYAELVSLINGTSAQYSKASDLPISSGTLNLSTGGVLVSNTPASGQSAVNKNYVDVRLGGLDLDLMGLADGKSVIWNASQSKWQLTSLASGTVTSVSGTAPISVAMGTSSPVISIQAGSSVGEVLKWSGAAWFSGFVNASQLKSSLGLTQLPTTTCDSSKTIVYLSPTDTYSCTSILISTGQITGLGGAATLSVGTTLGTVAAGDDSRIVNGLQSGASAAGDLSGTFGNPTVAKIRNISVSPAAPNNGQVLKYNSTSTQWEPSSDNSNYGTVTGVTAGTGLTGGTISGSGTIAVDVGTSANKIVQLDGSARLPAVDGSQLTGIPIPFSSVQVFNSAGTSSWTVPANINKVFVQVWGGGGGGAGGTALSIAGSGGGAGGYGAGFLAVTPGASLSVTVGAGGTGGPVGSDGVAGGQSSLGTAIVANGGAKGLATSNGPTFGGTVSGANAVITISGGSGGGAAPYIVSTGSLGGNGGNCGMGGGGGGGSSSAANPGAPGSQPGGGGGGGGSVVLSASSGGAGASGRVIIWY